MESEFFSNMHIFTKIPINNFHEIPCRSFRGVALTTKTPRIDGLTDERSGQKH